MVSLHYFCVGTMHDFQAKYLNKQQRIAAACTVYSHSLYIAAYPRAEVLLLILVWLQLINGKRGQLPADDSKWAKVARWSVILVVPQSVLFCFCEIKGREAIFHASASVTEITF